MNVNETLDRLINLYGDGGAGDAPRPEQWLTVLRRSPEAPFALVNFFKFRERAEYGVDSDEALSGEAAFGRYAEVSIPSMEKAGGSFLTVSSFAGSLLGPDEDWDLIAIGRYPNLNAFLALYENADYVAAFRHRVAAVSRQSVLVIEQ